MRGGLRGGGGPGGGANADPQGDLSEIRTIIQVFEEMWASGYRVALFPDADRGNWPGPSRTPGQVPAHYPETYVVLQQSAQVPEVWGRRDLEGLAEELTGIIEDQTYRVALDPDAGRHIVLLAHSDDSYPPVGELPFIPIGTPWQVY